MLVQPLQRLHDKDLYYHPTSGLMQILHFDWLRYYRSISNSHQVAKFADFVNLFISFYSQIKNFFLLNLLLLFSVRLVETKTIRPFALKGHGSIAHLASPHGLLPHSLFGLRI